jgi:hypothetical protein
MSTPNEATPLTPAQKEKARTQYRSLSITQEVLDALKSAAQVKGSPLSDDERASVYARFEV